MKSALFLFLSWIIFCKVVLGQTVNAYDCEGMRYLEKVFSSTTQATVKYGQNTNNGSTQELFMDVFEPENDTVTKRPVVIFAHGGYFLFGDRTEMRSLCVEFARRGYVAATIDYRKLPPGTNLNPINATEAIVRTMQDMKAAVRYFRHDSKTNNTFKVDTNFIFVGGYSAGAITALHTAYWSKDDNSAIGIGSINTIVNAQGGLEGQSNNFFDVSSQVQGVINHSGALLNKDWVQSTEPPIVSYHGTNDDVVPIGTGQAGGVIVVDGSRIIHQKANQLGVSNYLYAVNGGGHTNIYGGNDYITYLDAAFSFYKQKVLCKQITSISQSQVKDQIEVFPNPAHHFLVVRRSGTGTEILKINLFDSIGRLFGTWELTNDHTTIDMSKLSAGIYFYVIKNNSQNVTKSGKLIISSK